MSKRKKSSSKSDLRGRLRTSIPAAFSLRELAGAAFLALAVFIAYLPYLNGGFILDDDKLLTDNRIIKSPDGLYQFWCTANAQDYWPVSNTTLWLEWRLWEMNPTGYRVTNLILHVVEVVLMWVLLRKLSLPGAFLAALIFAVHPVNVESVTWISQRKGLLAMLFFQLSILCYLKIEIPSTRIVFQAINKNPRAQVPGLNNGNGIHRSPSTVHYILFYCLSLLAFVLAMLSKGSVAILPFLLLGILWWRRPLTKWDLARIAPFFLVAVSLAAVNVWFQTHGWFHIQGASDAIRNVGFPARVLGAGGVVWFYLYKAILPLNLYFIYPQWHIEAGKWWWWLPLAAALIVTVVLWQYRRTWSRPFLFAWGFFCVSLIPVLGIIDVGYMKHSLVADHYQHIAIMGVIALAAAGWGVWRQHALHAARWAAFAIAVAAIAALVLLTWQQSPIYSDEITLYYATLKTYPTCWIAHNNLGFLLAQTGRLDEAIEEFRKAVGINHDYPEAYNNLGSLLLKKGQVEEAYEHLQCCLKLRSDYPEAQYNMGAILFHLGKLPEAMEHFQQALKLKGDYFDAHNDLGILLLKTNRPVEAKDHFLLALRIIPHSAEAYGNLALAYAITNRHQDAVASAQRALELARAKKQTALVKQIEQWLNSYQKKVPK